MEQMVIFTNFAHLHKLITTLAILVAASLPCHAGDGLDYNLVMYTSDDMRTVYAFADHPRLTLSNSTFTITTGGGAEPSVCPKADYAVRDLHRFAIEDANGEPVDNVYWLVLSLKDNTIEAYPLADRPKITMDGGMFSVVSAERTVNYELKSIDRFRVTDTIEGNHHAINADVNSDGVVDVADISNIISVMAGGLEVAEPIQLAADVNGDGSVDVADISAVISVMASK